MKIQSHEIAMQSSHSFSKTYLESDVSFSTFFMPAPMSENEIDERFLEENPLEDQQPFFCDEPRTLNSIIQKLMNMLYEKSNSMMEDVNGKLGTRTMGYSHVSILEHFEEHETLDFSTAGKIQTDKGSIDLNINFSMSRSFAIENRIDIYNKFDPLVINLEGDIPSLSSDTFSFDLDNDGTSDQISKLSKGNGFLALDKNEDGEINQGSELFGTLSGNGFEELSAYDEDGNKWIDENDSIFDKLRIWLKNDDAPEGKELVGLGEVGVGAIFLQSSQSEFTYKTQTNQTLGEMKSCGLYLNEDGTCGNISQIDFASRVQRNIKHEEFAQAELKQKEPLAELLQA